VGSFSILPIGTYATSANFHQLRDTTPSFGCTLCEDEAKRKMNASFQAHSGEVPMLSLSYERCADQGIEPEVKGDLERA
jgi:hypothetical protein